MALINCNWSKAPSKAAQNNGLMVLITAQLGVARPDWGQREVRNITPGTYPHLGKLGWWHVLPMDLQWETLETRRRQQRLVFLYKILKEQVALPAKSIDITYSSRASRGCLNKQKLNRPGTRTTEYQNSFVHRTIPQWNALPESVAQTGTVSTFKCRLSALPQCADLVAVIAPGS